MNWESQVLKEKKFAPSCVKTLSFLLLFKVTFENFPDRQSNN